MKKWQNFALPSMLLFALFTGNEPSWAAALLGAIAGMLILDALIETGATIYERKATISNSVSRSSPT